MSESQLPSAFLENEFLRLEYLRTSGPRIIGLYAKGVEGNLLAETPDVHWETPNGEYYLRGGHRLWTAPENPFYTCPENGLNVIEGYNVVTLQSPVDAAGLEKEIAIRLDGNCVHLLHRVTWHGEQPIELAPWSITQLRLDGMAILPFSNRKGLLPNRNLVFWPYSQIEDDRFELHDDLALLYGQAKGFAFKIGNFNSYGWIAYTSGDSLFVKRFVAKEIDKYPDLGCNVEAYVKDTCIELESLGAMKLLNKNEIVTLDESWEILVGKYPATLESARSISKQLSQP
jgi:hypothetical protein